MSAADVLSNTLLSATEAWPNSSFVSPQECPTCAVSTANLTPLRCASARIAMRVQAAHGPQLPQLLPLGDGFARLQANATDVISAVRGLQAGQAFSIDYTRATDILLGSNVWILNWLNLSLPIEVPLFYDIVRPTDAVWAAAQANPAALNEYLLDELGYDCSIDETVETPEGWLLNRCAPAPRCELEPA